MRVLTISKTLCAREELLALVQAHCDRGPVCEHGQTQDARTETEDAGESATARAWPNPLTRKPQVMNSRRPGKLLRVLPDYIRDSARDG